MAYDIKMDVSTPNPNIGYIGGFVREQKAPAAVAENPGSGKLNRSDTNVNTGKLMDTFADGNKTDTNRNNNINQNDEKKTKNNLNTLNDVVTSLNTSIQSVQRNLEFSIDKELGEIVIKVTDKNTKEVVRQIPSEEALKLARNLKDVSRSLQSDNNNNTSKAVTEGIFFSSSA